ncbi:bridge-like lipid transfer protein family member 3A isoform 2-T2 [Anomaloglossus baeobatrachus]|uniref:bridge-like lipid transfer protein family member 3A isoform X2 n=1 Tax=Anomaloglossus baeobatrachus TaxID=238106 RepID=UPI003F4FFD55
MAAIIKRQILKHLSRFTKNLSPEQINLSTLRGEGHLTDLQLDEEALQNMLDLPTWLAITRVFCNRAAIRIQWTKLKTHPICLMLDKVEIEMKTCEDPRPPNGPSPIAVAAGQSEYGFAEKVVEGMFLEVGCVIIKIESQAFRASLQLWQLQGYSVSPTWQQSDLRFTRLTHPQRGEVLTFKQVTWQTLRIEADASESCEDAPSTPLRLLTNGGRLNVAFKRRTKDCLVLSSKLSFILDELLWVLTDCQLRALLSYTKSLGEAVQKSVRQKKEIGVGQVPSPTTPQWSVFSPNSSSTGLGQYFEKFDVKETSYHLLISRLEIHVCDESQTRSTVSGGAIQMTFRRIMLDYYPTHKSGQSCAHWNNYSPAMSTCEQWTQALADERQAKEHFNINMLGKMPSPKNEKGSTREPSLYFRAVLIRIDDMDFHQVSAPGQTPQKQPLLSCHRIPRASSAVHLQYIEYYCIPEECLPVPPPALYIQLNGLLLYLASQSILWLNVFMVDLSHHLQQITDVTAIVNEGVKENRDVRLDGFNLKLSFPVSTSACSPPDRPSCVSAHLSSVTLTNTRQAPGSTLDLLQNIFRSFAANEDFHCPPGPLHPVFLSNLYPSSDPPLTSLWTLHSPGLSFYFEGGISKHEILLHHMPLTALACLLLPELELQVMINMANVVRLQLNHYQYLTLLRFQEQLLALLEGLEQTANSQSDFLMRISSSYSIKICIGMQIPVVTISLLLPASISSVSPRRQVDSERSSLVGSELADGDMSAEKETDKGHLANKREIVDMFLGLEQGEEPEEILDVQKDVSQLHQHNNEDDLTKDSLPSKVLANDATQSKELSVDLLLGKEFARDALLTTLGLTSETFTLGKERMQRFLSDTKHKDVDVLHNRTSSPLSRAQSLDTVSIDGLDMLSLDSETTENFILKLETEMTLSGESVVTQQDDTSQSTEGPEPQQIFTVALHNVSSVLRLVGNDLSVTVKALDISCAQKVEDFKGLLASTSTTTTTCPRMILKFDHGPAAAYLSPLAVQNGFLQVHIEDFISEIPISALTHIGPFLEDEQKPEILPMIIQLTNCKILLSDDGPRIYPSPIAPEPVAFSLKNLKVQRLEDGVFWLTGNESYSLISLPKRNASQKLPDSKEELQRELLAAHAKLEQQQKQEQRLLEEIQKYNPQFHL